MENKRNLEDGIVTPFLKGKPHVWLKTALKDVLARSHNDSRNNTTTYMSILEELFLKFCIIVISINSLLLET